jgi:DNA-directed RNA polymerase subunit K/omega
MSLTYKTNNIEDSGKVLESLNNKKISKLIMSKYEFDNIIGLRTIQLANGSPPFIKKYNAKIKSNMELRAIALEELKEGKLPFIIERPLPNNKKEYVRVRDLDLIAIRDRMR